MNVDTDTQWAYLVGIRVGILSLQGLFPTLNVRLQDFFDKKKDYIQTQVGNPEGSDKPNKKVGFIHGDDE
jgi:fructose-bisphosphate aldolase class II